MQIKVLSEQLASQIAAGEVVERPAAAVKELVENALDAGATTINIDIRAGGQRLIQVADNGSGIPANEVEIAFLRHATSKLDTIDALNHIETLGFRGEALAAIAAVSRLTVITRTPDETAGTRLVLDGGHFVSSDTVGAPQGTVIAVEDLFYNTPARLKFLKSTPTEKRYIDEFVTRYALAYPDVRFRLTHDGRVTFRTSGNGSVRDIMVTMFGVDTARAFLAIGAERPDAADATAPNERAIRVSGLVSPPSLHRANRTQISLFVNGRWVKDRQLTYAIVNAYHTLLPKGRFPLAMVFVTLPSDEVDVNVHPTKTEVRFRKPNKVFSAIQRAVRETIVGVSPIRPISHFASAAGGSWAGSLGQHAAQHTGAWDDYDDAPAPYDDANGQRAFDLPQPALPPVDIGATTPAPDTRPALGGGKLPIMRVIGQVGASYIITEGPDGLFLIDQHAAHERILYEQFMDARHREQIASQGLVTGAVVQLTPDQATLLEAHLETLTAIGFHIEPFGPNAFVVRALPAILTKRDPAQALVEVVDDLMDDKVPLAEDIEARIIMRVCKTAAVKAGQTLATAEVEAMVRQLEACRNPHTCPHGRPTLIHLSVAQLAREFGRI